MSPPLAPRHPELDESRTRGLIATSLGCLHREYPNVILHIMESDADALTPRQMKPAFYGCLDWHSAVHNHWALIRLLRFFPQISQRNEVLAALETSWTAKNILGELAYLNPPYRRGFEVPYGMAWLLHLTRELRLAHELPPADHWLSLLKPLETLARERLLAWLSGLPTAIRGGEHSQSAFALGLMHDWARTTHDRELQQLIQLRAEEFHENDIGWPFRFEPSAYDFLSPGLAAADLLRRVWEPERFTTWLEQFLSGWTADSLAPVRSADSSSGKLSHWDGLNLSRAWMLDGIAEHCCNPALRLLLLGQARGHLLAGLPHVSGLHYAGAHWLVSFAVYALSGGGLTEL